MNINVKIENKWDREQNMEMNMIVFVYKLNNN